LGNWFRSRGAGNTSTEAGETAVNDVHFEDELGGFFDPATAQNGLTVVSVGKSFKRRPVVRGVSLSLNRGEAVGLLGPNGAGKTTVFYMIIGLIAAEIGRAHV